MDLYNGVKKVSFVYMRSIWDVNILPNNIQEKYVWNMDKKSFLHEQIMLLYCIG